MMKMKRRMGLLLIMLLTTLVAAPAVAATYDASGIWALETGADATLFGFDISNRNLQAEIEQLQDDTFTIEITNMSDFAGSGTVDGNQYTIDLPADASVVINPAESFPDVDNVPDLDLEVSISSAGFLLTSEDELTGSIELGAMGLTDTVNFTGSRDNVPVPAAVWLFGSGIVALFGVRKRFKA
jgi:hypothetical protein